MTFEEFLTPPEDERPIVGNCEECGSEIHGETEGYFADEYYEFDGIKLCRDCLQVYFDKHYLIGG